MATSELNSMAKNLTKHLKFAAESSNLRHGRQAHAQILVNGLSGDVKAATAAITMYSSCNSPNHAHKVFNEMPERDVISYNAVISSFSRNGMPSRALEMVVELQANGERPDSVSVVAALPAVAALGSVNAAKSFHGYSLRAGLSDLVNVSSALVNAYAKCSSLTLAERVFNSMREKPVVAWNSLLNVVEPAEVLRLYEKMTDVTDVTIMAVARACAELGDLDTGKKLHRRVRELRPGDPEPIMNSLISMYAKCGELDAAVEAFEALRHAGRATIATWNVVIGAYAKNRQAASAVATFVSAVRECDASADSFTFTSVIPAVAELSVVSHGKWIHGMAVRRCLADDVFVATALVDMYAKCGAVCLARRVFETTTERPVITWNAMIDGYGAHGRALEALQLVNEMRENGTFPSEITFLSVISSCAHAGLVEEGRRAFATMRGEFGLEPGVSHYAAMVDLLGRAGLLDEAWEMIRSMPIEPDINVYGAMLAACKLHANVPMAEKAAEPLFELNPSDGGYHVLMSNIYANAGMWAGVARIRTAMEKKGLCKVPGMTSVELRGKIHTFFSGDSSHRQSERIYAKLDSLMVEIKAAGYVTKENDERRVSRHSERLAIAFALISSPEGTTIQLRKNLRVCEDCHSVTKFMTLVTGREIVVRDLRRFHHFKDGQCSCGDYW